VVLSGGGAGGEEDDGEGADPGGGEQRERSFEEAFSGSGRVGALDGGGDEEGGAEQARGDHDGAGWSPWGELAQPPPQRERRDDQHADQYPGADRVGQSAGAGQVLVDRAAGVGEAAG